MLRLQLFKAPFRLLGGRSVSQSASFTVKPCDLRLLERGPATEVSVTRDDALLYFRQMAIIRRMETTANAMYKRKEIRGFCHLYSGQEACCVGMEAAIRQDDPVITAYRAHGWAYTRGISVLGVLAELTGVQDGCARGKGGSMHMYNQNFFGGNGIVGAQVPLGAGIGLHLKLSKQDKVCVALYGDGAANQGQVFEAFNMAALWKLPVIFVCENNHFGMGTSTKRAAANTDFYTRGDAVPGVRVDGMDVLAVRSATSFAREYALSTGPILLELATYRYHGHSMSDPGVSYRTRDDIQQVRQNDDPIKNLAQRIIDSDLATPEELQSIESKVKDEVSKAEKAAIQGKELPLEELYHDVFYNTPGTYIKGCEPYTFYQSR